MRADVDSPDLLDPSIDGYHVTASWALTGEMRGYNKKVGIFQRLPIARSVNQNGWGAVELGLRYSTLDGNDSLLQAAWSDEVLTAGGILGVITGVSEHYAVIKVSDNTEIKIQKQSVSLVVPKGTYDEA